MKAILLRHNQIISVALVITCVFGFELILMHVKYNLFAGGFLQPYSYTSLVDRTEFILVSLIFDSFFYWALSIPWFYFSYRRHKNGVLFSFYYFAIVTSIMGAVIAAKYQLLSYFSDTVNLLILKNLAGGSVESALAYASNEIGLAISAAVIAIVSLYFLVRKLKYSKIVQESPLSEKVLGSSRKVLLGVLTFIIGLSFVCVSNPELRYGLSKKTSFGVVTTVLDMASDIDFDGAGSFSLPFDTDIMNSNIYPGAVDIPGNGIDEDGLLGDAPSFSYNVDTLPALLKQHQSAGKHIVFIVLESTRADLLDKKLNGKFVAPNIRSLAETGAVFNKAYSHSGYSTSSLKEIFNRQMAKMNRTSFVNLLKSLGYQLSFISGQDESFGNVANAVGMSDEGNYLFDARTAIDDRVYASKNSGSLRLSEERVIEGFLARAQELDFNRPQFFYFNFQAAHFPYSHKNMQKILIDEFIPRSKITLENKQWLADTYWNAVANADWAVGQVIKYFEKIGLSDELTLVILSDHGESLFDDGFLGHGHLVNDAQTQIPLIVKSGNLQTNQQVNDAIGQISVAEVAIRAALDLPITWQNRGEPVFQIIGSLKSPVLIAHRYVDGTAITFDFRTEHMYASQSEQWLSLKESLGNDKYSEKIKNLILEWERLRWADEQSKTQ